MNKVWDVIVYVVMTTLLMTIGAGMFIVHVVVSGLLVVQRNNGMVKKIVLLIFIVALVIGGYGLYSYYAMKDIGAGLVTVVIKPGDSFAFVADSLVNGGVVKSARALKVAARIRGVDKKLVVGRYDFSGDNSIQSALDKLASGDFLKVRVTIIEGSPIWRVASQLARTMNADSAEVIALSKNAAFLQELKLPYLEGYLFPETYFFPWHTGAKEALSQMVQMFRGQTENVISTKSANGLTPEQVLILASIVEAEAMIDAEKPKIASVYLNRLEKRMRLDADPTVIYGLGGLDRPLYTKDIAIITPYNTYRKYGLPPTPINSPGLEAIKAVLSPDIHEYLFFVADGSGGHRFTKTNAEHNRARRDIRRARKAAGG